MDIKEVFRGIGIKMLSDFDNIHLQIHHSGARGAEREAGFKDFLASYLPGRYGLSRGEIVDSTGQTSRECDLVIYDHLNSPILLIADDYQVFPAESVFAIVEVKSTLGTKNLDAAIENIKTVKSLSRENGIIVGVLFSYKAKFHGNPIDAIAEQMQQASKTIPQNQLIDLICVLDQGVITNCGGKNFYDVNSDSGRVLMGIRDFTDLPILLHFYQHFMGYLSQQISRDPDIDKYAVIGSEGPIEVGYAKKYELF